MTSILDFTIQIRQKKNLFQQKEKAEEPEAQLAAFLATLKPPCLRKRVHQLILPLLIVIIFL